MSLSPQFLDELRTRTNLSALVARTVKLTKAGREHKGCCPFHNEKTPSFYVNDEKGFYHCFGCSAHGDAIRWMTDQRGLPFMDAVKELAAAAGMDVPAADPRTAERAERANSLYDVMTAAQAWFTEQLYGTQGAEARAYLEKRGITAETAKTFGLGFAPDSRGKLKTALATFGDDKLIEAGLLILVEEKQPYDRFRGRLMIPIRDQRGRVIAFGGRIIGAGEPKYLNSPDTPLFDKGRTLYNLDLAGSAIRRSDQALIVEGYLDVISLSQAEFAQSVAPLGTAITDAQLGLIWRICDSPILCLDGDAAGRKAADRACVTALRIGSSGKTVRVALMPTGEDPDEVVRGQGKDHFSALITQAVSADQFIYDFRKAKIDPKSANERGKLKADLFAVAADCQDVFLKPEIKQNFRGYFEEDFGWQARFRHTIRHSALRTGPLGEKRLLKLYIRSALFGLAQLPMVLSAQFQTLAEMRIDHPQLRDWQHDLVEAVLTAPTPNSLDSDAIEAILEIDRLTPKERDALPYDLRFPHQRVGLAPSQAAEKLVGLLRFLSAEQDLLDELARLDAKCKADDKLEDYYEIEMARQHVRQNLNAIRDTAYELGQEQEVIV